MENLEQKPDFIPNIQTTTDTTLGIQNQTVIIVLIVFMGLSFLGINIITIFKDLIESIISIFWPMIAQILSIFGYTTGSVINKTADVVGNVAKTGVDVAEGSLQSVGTILKDVSRKNVNPATTNSLDAALNVGPTQYSEPHPDSTTNPIQNPISSGKAGWCLVGEYEGRRGCVSVGESDKCMSGQVYPSQAACITPASFAGGIPNPR